MRAYANHYLVEEQRQQIYQDEIEREQWVSERAEELKDKWPEDLITLASPYQFKNLPGFLNDAAIDAYADLVNRACVAQAESDWKLREFLGPVMFAEEHANDH